MRIVKAIAAFLLVLWGSTALAEEHAAQQIVQGGIENVLKILAENSERIKTDEAFLRDTINEHITPNLDFVSMTKLVLGKNWRKAKPEQRSAMVEQFHLLLLNTYTKSLSQYSGQSIEFLPFRAGKKPDTRAVVKSAFKQAGGPDIPIDYKLIKKKDVDWKVYDIAIDGISLVTNYRTSFANKINTVGLDALIEELDSKNSGGE